MTSVDWLCVVIEQPLGQETGVRYIGQVLVVQVGKNGVLFNRVELQIFILELIVLLVLFIRIEMKL